MKTIVEYFLKKKVFFKSLNEVDKALLGTKKRLTIYRATDTKGNYHSIFKIDQKSRFLVKNAKEISELEERLRLIENHNFKFKHLLIVNSICSKSVCYLKERGWKIYYDFV